MSLSCHDCGSKNLRTSLLRFRDVLHLLEFQYPVRCRICKKRWYAPLFLTLHLPRSTHGRVKVQKPL